MGADKRQGVKLDNICRELSEQFIKWWDGGKSPLKVYDLEGAVIDYKNAKRAYDYAK